MRRSVKSAYIFFSSAKRPEAKEAVMEEKGDDFKTSDVTAKLGAMWRSFVRMPRPTLR